MSSSVARRWRWHAERYRRGPRRRRRISDVRASAIVLVAARVRARPRARSGAAMSGSTAHMRAQRARARRTVRARAARRGPSRIERCSTTNCSSGVSHSRSTRLATRMRASFGVCPAGCARVPIRRTSMPPVRPRCGACTSTATRNSPSRTPLSGAIHSAAPEASRTRAIRLPAMRDAIRVPARSARSNAASESPNSARRARRARRPDASISCARAVDVRRHAPGVESRQQIR